MTQRTVNVLSLQNFQLKVSFTFDFYVFTFGMSLSVSVFVFANLFLHSRYV